MALSRDSEDLMSRIRSLAGIGVLAAVLSVAGTTTAHAAETVRAGVNQAGGTQSGETLTRFIVKRDTTVSDAQFARSLRAAGLTLVKAQPSLRLAVVEGPAGALGMLRDLPGAASVARD